jgi:formylglycine-generating enzyme required for sulfatase activity
MPGLIRRRAAAAEALARIESGTPGTQPAFWSAFTGEPVWTEVPAGAFWMGSEQGSDNEKPLHKIDLAHFWIARVPITNAQYHFFVEATDHPAPEHWDDGRVPRGLEAHPVVNISWHDAIAYCAWLTEVLHEGDGRYRLRMEPSLPIRDASHIVSLPSEVQWEKAARGPVLSEAEGTKRDYPWGEIWDATRCNNEELGLGGTTPVGIFPNSASPYGVLEMAGNVWEWTQSQWSNYPYAPDENHESFDAEENAPQILRGGAFDSNRELLRCSSRRIETPNTSRNNIGFRVVVFPTSTDF